MLLAQALLSELGQYLDGEVNNRDLTVTDGDGNEWSIHSGLFRDGNDKDWLELLLEDASGNRCGVTIKLTVEDAQFLPPRP